MVGVLTHLTSRSPAMMSELKKLFLLTDENDIRIRAQYVRSAANIWADKLRWGTDTAEWKLAPRVFRHLDTAFHEHTIERFASRENKQLPRYNAKWRC